MAYSIHITRDQKETSQEPISLAEWISLVNSTPSLELTSSLSAKNKQGQVIEIGGDGLAVWSNADRKIIFSYFGGSISTSTTDVAVQFKMYELACALDAEVRGDEGELYEPPEKIKNQIAKHNTKQSHYSKANQIGLKANLLLDKFWVKALLVIVVIAIVAIKDLWFDS